MFGKNLVERPTPDLEKLEVFSIFPTIQGEGPLAGTPAIFIRLAGCNLKCFFCDTDFTSHRNEMRPQEIVDSVLEIPVKHKLVVLTGGEPLRQDVMELIYLLRLAGYNVQIETAGTLWRDKWKLDAQIVCSPKTPTLNPMCQQHIDAYKYIIAFDDALDVDGLPMSSTQKNGKMSGIAKPPATFPRSMVFVQPRDDHDAKRNEKNLQRAAEVAQKYGYRLSVQIHKLAGLD